jgi:hypothetical protein
MRTTQRLGLTGVASGETFFQGKCHALRGTKTQHDQIRASFAWLVLCLAASETTTTTPKGPDDAKEFLKELLKGGPVDAKEGEEASARHQRANPKPRKEGAWG